MSVAMRILTRGFPALVACAALPALGRAQGTVPMELARVLISGVGSVASRPEAAIVVGEAPNDFPRELLAPAPATVLGGSRVGDVVRAVMVVATADDSAYVRALRAAGWQPFNGGSMTSTMNGFVASGLVSPSGTTMLCQGGARLATISSAPRAEGGRYLVVGVNSGAMAELCRRSSATPMTPFGDAPYPSLVAPEGTTIRRTGRGGGGDRYSAEIDLATSLDAAKLVSHFAQQLPAQGWKLGEHTGTAAAALQVADKTMADGTRWHLLLFGERAPGAEVTVAALRLTRVTSR